MPLEKNLNKDPTTKIGMLLVRTMNSYTRQSAHQHLSTKHNGTLDISFAYISFCHYFFLLQSVLFNCLFGLIVRCKSFKKSMFLSKDSFYGPMSLDLISLGYLSLDVLSLGTPSNKVLCLENLSLEVSLLIERLNYSS
ncbi:hypothetical protein EDC96DRAFT_565519 [Choanephora cucurbitarum]|nr:hypothetical protein EDC96DRAFT_565519 [Choanephora cucurbitarum]